MMSVEKTYNRNQPTAIKEPKQFYYKQNRLQQLRGFCYAAQFGNISRAAEHMGLTHASVSLQIKALETDLGTQLFERNGPHIKLTQQGELLLDLALPHIDGIQNLHHVFQEELQISKKTELHVAANSTTLNFILPDLVKEFVARYPDCFVTIHYAEHEDAILKLREERVDFALLPRRDHKPFPKGIHYLPMFYFPPALITRPDHPLCGRTNLTVEEISRYELTLPAEDLRVIPTLYEIFPQHSINKKLRVSFINWETTRRYIEAGLVISISSDVIIGKDDKLVATPLTHLFPMVDYGFVTWRQKRQSAKVRKFVELARGRAASLVRYAG